MKTYFDQINIWSYTVNTVFNSKSVIGKELKKQSRLQNRK